MKRPLDMRAARRRPVRRGFAESEWIGDRLAGVVDEPGKLVLIRCPARR